MSDDAPSEGLVPRFARPALRAGDVTGWFEPVYAGAGDRIGDVPWVDQAPNTLLVSWLRRERASGDGARAVVVGCGVGDDVEPLLEAGYDAIGFDVAPTAIAWAARRFPGSAERFRVANLLELPRELTGAFALVFEAYTVQALPQAVRERALAAVASLVAPGGRLLVVCSGRDPEDDPGRLPWPLTRDDLARFTGHGLSELRFEDLREDGSRQFRVLYERQCPESEVRWS